MSILKKYISVLLILSLVIIYVPNIKTNTESTSANIFDRTLTGVGGALLIAKGYMDLTDVISNRPRTTRGNTNQRSYLKTAFWTGVALTEISFGLIFFVTSCMGKKLDSRHGRLEIFDILFNM